MRQPGKQSMAIVVDYGRVDAALGAFAKATGFETVEVNKAGAVILTETQAYRCRWRSRRRGAKIAFAIAPPVATPRPGLFRAAQHAAAARLVLRRQIRAACSCCRSGPSQLKTFVFFLGR
jgi:hypothetical protein